jgi:acetyl-CoA carboxylase biotin carboxylase subunit
MGINSGSEPKDHIRTKVDIEGYHMFSKILVANRGEIACRIIASCRKLGIPSVAVYSSADRNGLHTRIADEAFEIGEAEASLSYLNQDALLKVAVEHGVDAIHPGYGFLSENSKFVEKCEQLGISFIGPTAYAIEQMGNKIKARQIAIDAGVPVIPGSEGAVGDQEAEGIARMIGFPVMVKASGGGGGIGMSIAENTAELSEALRKSRSLAQSSFGNAEVYLEKYLPLAAHIEVQVLGDNHGNAVHLFERDCSIQRRNQKVIEETPTLKLTQNLREDILSAALTLAKHIGYKSAGTVEFIVDSHQNFYFLEMNTRLQVEHAITEMITGIDIVEYQIRVAANQVLDISQDNITRTGHSIECRIYPEDPYSMMPQAGVLTGVSLPKGNGIRVDHALFLGYEVSSHYEPLMAKLITWGKNRDEAIRKMRSALEDTVTEGVVNNIPLILAVLRNQEFILGTYHTKMLDSLAIDERWNRFSIPGTAITVSGPKALQENMARAIIIALQTLKKEKITSTRTSMWKHETKSMQFRSREFEKTKW